MDFRGTEGIPYVKLSALEVGIKIERFVLGKGETSEAGTAAMLKQGWSLYPPASSPSSSRRPGYSRRCSLGDRHRHHSVVLSLLALSCPSSLSSLLLLFARPYHCPIVIIVSVHSCPSSSSSSSSCCCCCHCPLHSSSSCCRTIVPHHQCYHRHYRRGFHFEGVGSVSLYGSKITVRI